jgi:hypothetical protein
MGSPTACGDDENRTWMGIPTPISAQGIPVSAALPCIERVSAHSHLIQHPRLRPLPNPHGFDLAFARSPEGASLGLTASTRVCGGWKIAWVSQ